MAAMTVAGWFAAPVIEELIKKVSSYLKSLHNWQRDMDDDVKKLRLALTENLAIVTASQQQYTGDNTFVEQWVLQIKDAIYDAEDVLDEFEYRWLKAQADRSGSAVSRTFFCSLILGKRLIRLDDFRTTLKKMLQRLKEVHDSVMSLSQVVDLVQKTEVDPPRVTSSIQPAHEIFGRDKEREEIVTMLLKPVDEPESSSSRKRIPVIPIVGLGGFGKTTLARLVYNDSRIVNHFDTRIWVCVSNSFDKIRLTKDILESMSKADEKFEDVNNFQKLQESLQSKLKSKKFLLILDDVWLNEKMKDWKNKESWDQVLGPLNQAAAGSKILVTTRIPRVAKMFEATNWIPLEGLANVDYWLLFKSCAFGNAIPGNHLELETIGREITARLHGSPLAATVIGALLRDKLDVNEWKEILKKEMFDDILEILKLSYQRLPNHLKPCFGYCSIFPKDWKFESEKLILLWIAQGYIQTPNRDQRLMKDAKKEYFNQMISIGKEYFNQLLVRSFFQKVEQDSHIYYVIHDFMHDLSQSVSKDECSRINNRDMSTITETVRHLGIVVENELELVDILSQLEKMSNLNKLRTLMIFGNRRIKFPKLSPSVFKDLKSLRILDLGKLNLEKLPGALDHFLHLRYLNLGYGGSVMLPKSLLELYHLQVLATEQGLRLSRSTVRLIKSGRLARLDVGPLVYYVEKGRGHRIGVLKDMKKEKLCIENVENISRKKDAIKAKLGSKGDLDGLVLRWDFSERINKRDTDKKVAEGLKPHQNLRDLEIYGFGGTRSPSWLETNWLISLTTIELSHCGCLQVLPPLGQLPCLKSLTIESMHAIKRVTSEFYGDKMAEKKGFPSLVSLEFSDMPEWSEWHGVEEFPIFPRLRELTVRSSPKLMRFPLLPPTLSEVSIHDTGLVSLLVLETESSSSSEKYFRMTSSVIPSYRALLPDELLRAIKDLEIRWSQGRMPAEGIVELAALKDLTIESCPELLASEEEDGPGVLPSSLKSLQISDCHVTDRWLSRCLQGLTSLSLLWIDHCTGLTSLPSAQVLRNHTGLQKLLVMKCKELTSLGGLHALQSLTHLGVRACRKLKSLPEEGLPHSVQRLLLAKCDPAFMQQMREKKSPEWDKVAHIPHVEIS